MTWLVTKEMAEWICDCNRDTKNRCSQNLFQVDIVNPFWAVLIQGWLFFRGEKCCSTQPALPDTQVQPPSPAKLIIHLNWAHSELYTICSTF